MKSSANVLALALEYLVAECLCHCSSLWSEGHRTTHILKAWLAICWLVCAVQALSFLSWVSTVGSRSCTSFNGSRLKCCSALVLTLKLTLCWHYVDVASALMLHCSDVDCAVRLAERWCQRWHCLDVDVAPPVKLIVLSGAGLSNSGASPADTWAQSSMKNRYELWNIFIESKLSTSRKCVRRLYWRWIEQLTLFDEAPVISPMLAHLQMMFYVRGEIIPKYWILLAPGTFLPI